MLTLKSTFLPYFHWPIYYDKPQRFLYPRPNPFELKLRPIQRSTDMRANRYKGIPTFWPAFEPLVDEYDEGSIAVGTTVLSQMSAKQLEIRETRKKLSLLSNFYNPSSDYEFFKNKTDAIYAYLWPVFPYISDEEKAKYRAKWEYVIDNEFRMLKNPTSVELNEYIKRVYEILDFEATTGYVPDWNNIPLVEKIVPHYSEFAPEDQLQIRERFENRKRKLDTGNFPGGIQQLRWDYIWVNNFCAWKFPWNDKTCTQYFPGYVDLDENGRAAYQNLRRQAAFQYWKVYSSNNEEAGDAIWLNDLSITNFQYQNSQKERDFYKQVTDWKAKVGAEIYKLEDALSRASLSSLLPGEIFSKYTIPVFGLDTGVSFSDAIKGSILASGVIITAFTAGAVAPILAGATGLTTTTATAAYGAVVTGSAAAATGGNPLDKAKDLVGVGKELAPSLGVDLTLPGVDRIPAAIGDGKNMGLFDTVQAFGNDTMKALSSVNLSDLGSSVQSVVGNIGNLSGSDVVNFGSDLLGQITVGDVAKVVTPAAPTQTAQQAANTSTAVNKAVASIKENKVPIAVIAAVAIAAYFYSKGKF